MLRFRGCRGFTSAVASSAINTQEGLIYEASALTAYAAIFARRQHFYGRALSRQFQLRLPGGRRGSYAGYHGASDKATPASQRIRMMKMSESPRASFRARRAPIKIALLFTFERRRCA